MALVEINALGRHVKVEQDGRDAETLMPLAQKAWEETKPEREPVGFKPGGGDDANSL